MGVAASVALFAAITASASAGIAALTKPKAPKKRAAVSKQSEIRKPKDLKKFNARKALVAGSPLGVESQLSTSGRGTLLGN